MKVIGLRKVFNHFAPDCESNVPLIPVKNAGPRYGRFAASGKFASLFRITSRFYSVAMTRRLNNWSYQDVTEFLKGNGFSFFEELKGSRQAWIKLQDSGEPDRIAELSFREDHYPEKTLKRIIRQSGISEKEWREWDGPQPE